MINRWTVLLGCTIALAVSFGPAYLFTFGILLKPMAAEFHWSRTQASAGFSIAVLAAVVSGTPAGFLVDRSGNRIVVLAAAILLPLAIGSIAFAPSFTVFAVLACLVGLVGGGSNAASIISLLPQWFDRKLGLSLGLASLGIGLGSALMPLAAAHFLQRFGWRGAFIAVAVLVAVIGILGALVLVHDNPEFRSRRLRAATLSEAGASLDDVGFTEAIRSWTFWRIAISFALICMVYWGVITHLPAIMTDSGYPPAQAAWAVSLSGVAAIAARLGCGILLDYVSVYVLGFVFFAGTAVACALLSTGLPGVLPYVGSFLLGLGLGAESDIMAYTLRRRFGLRAHARIYGFCFALFNVGAVIGPLLMGVAYDKLGSYKVAIGALAAVALLGAVMFGTIRPQPRLARQLNR